MLQRHIRLTNGVTITLALRCQVEQMADGCAGRAQAMDAGCGHQLVRFWDGPVTCNKPHGIAAREAVGGKVCEYDASSRPCLGHDTVCSGCPQTILLGSLESESAR